MDECRIVCGKRVMNHALALMVITGKVQKVIQYGFNVESTLDYEGERQFLKGMMGMPMFKRSMAVLLVIMAVAAGVTMWEMYDGDEVQLLADNRLSAG